MNILKININIIENVKLQLKLKTKHWKQLM